VICEEISDERREAWDERAAIIEEGCQVSRAESEKMAAEQMSDYEIEFLQGSGL
jgi:hypothetical protein